MAAQKTRHAPVYPGHLLREKHARLRLHTTAIRLYFAEMGGWVYIVTNQRDGTLYVGVTSDLPRRIWEHREGVVEGFTKQYRLKHLVWFERHDEIVEAIRREKRMKKWPRQWKINVIEAMNPDWNDLYGQLI